MLAYDRLVASGRCGPRAARRREASASLRPAGGAAATVAVAMEGT
jgi:hypothetical protein